MIIKAHLGDGVWGMWEAEFDVTFLGHHCFIDVPVGDHDYWSDERFPLPGPEGLIHVHHTEASDDRGLDGGDSPKVGHVMRWVRWRTEGQTHLLITDGPVYICNDQGDTIEALR